MRINTNLSLLTISAAAILLLTGCGINSTGPMVAGANNTFRITHSESVFPTGNGVSMLEGATEEAKKYCKNKNLNMTIVHTAANTGPYILNHYPSGTIVFTCINDKELKQNNLLQDVGANPTQQTKAPQNVNATEKLSTIKKMYEDGLITREEYDKKRQDVLDKY